MYKIKEACGEERAKRQSDACPFFLDKNCLAHFR
jgi:hypothetical protein